jgi:hypothetical protein
VGDTAFWRRLARAAYEAPGREEEGSAMALWGNGLRWIASAGGPLILLDERYLSAWLGSDQTDDFDLDAPEEPSDRVTDYDRACAVAVDGYIGILAVDGGQAVVFGGEPMSTAWIPRAASEGIFVRSWYADVQDEERLVEHVASIDEEAWTPTGFTLQVDGQPLLLFDAAYSGLEAAEDAEHLTVALDAGRYAIESTILEPSQRAKWLVHRFRRR